MYDWTHTNVKMTDIRKLSEFYIFTIEDVNSEVNNQVLMVKDKIFEERLKMYFLKDPSRITREEILSVKWNMYITKGFYVKIKMGNKEPEVFNMDPNKFYVSYLEIAGPLGSFCNIIKDRENHQ